jgi:hypothetical protein
MSGLACRARLDFAGSGPLTASLARAHRGLEARFTTNRDYTAS